MVELDAPPLTLVGLSVKMMVVDIPLDILLDIPLDIPLSLVLFDFVGVVGVVIADVVVAIAVDVVVVLIGIGCGSKHAKCVALSEKMI